jgi:hypothetical protein
LPEESPDAVVELARQFGATLLVLRSGTDREWPEILNGAESDAKCFQEVPLSDNHGAAFDKDSALATIHVFRIVCP